MDELNVWQPGGGGGEERKEGEGSGHVQGYP